MKDGICTKGFPKDYAAVTENREDSYPRYQRSAECDGGRIVVLQRRRRDILVSKPMGSSLQPVPTSEVQCSHER